MHVLAPDHPLARASGYVLEHRMVAWDAGLFDDPSLDVHHRDGDKLNNDSANLEPMTVADHARDHDHVGPIHRAKTHCPQGHPYDDANTYIWRDRRKCRACRRDRAGR